MDISQKSEKEQEVLTQHNHPNSFTDMALYRFPGAEQWRVPSSYTVGVKLEENQKLMNKKVGRKGNKCQSLLLKKSKCA